MALIQTKIIACIPHFRCKRYIRRAVESLLVQTYGNLAIVVVNDGDPDPPWGELTDIRDPRLIRFSLGANHGPYFATAVVLNATTAPYLLIQDADDWSAPDRVAQLLNRLERDHSDLAVSAQPLHQERNDGSTVIVSVECCHPPGLQLGTRLRHLVPHQGLFRAQSVRDVGGYYGGFRMGYDTLLTNLVLMTGKISHVQARLYHRLRRPGSLTTHHVTGFKSEAREAILNRLAMIYRQAHDCYTRYLRRQITSVDLKMLIRHLCLRNISADTSEALRLESQRLSAILSSR